MRKTTLSLFAAALALSLGLTADPADAGKRRYVTIGTGGVTGVYYPTGGAICRQVNKNRRTHNIRCSVESTGGSVYNANTISIGELDLGVVQSDVGYQAWHGEGKFKEKVTKLRSVFSIHPETLTLAARKDAGMTQLTDIVGKKVNIGNPGSGQEATVSLLMETCGIKKSQLALAGGLKAVEMPDALRDKKLDAYFYMVGHPTANFKDAATSTEINIVPVTGACVDKLVAAKPYYVKGVTPGGIYKGVKYDVPTYGVKATLLSSTDVPEDVIYEVVKGVFENLDAMRKLHPAFKRLTQEKMLEGLTAPFHPGAIKYYKEKGLM